MKKILLIAIILSMILITSVSAVFYGNDFQRISSYDNSPNCRENQWTSCNMISDYKIWDNNYIFDDEELAFELLNAITPDVLGDLTFIMSIGWTIDPRINQTPLVDSVKNFTFSCYKRQTLNGSTQTTEELFYYNFTPTSYDSSDTDQWEFIELALGEQVYCQAHTYYNNASNFYEVNAIVSKIYTPTIASPLNTALKKKLLKKDVEIEDLENQVQEKHETTVDFLVSSLKALVEMNMEILIVIFWVFRIAMVLFGVGIIIYLILWVYRYIKKLAEK